MTGKTDPELGDLNALAGVSEYRSRIRCATLPWSALGEAWKEEHYNMDDQKMVPTTSWTPEGETKPLLTEECRDQRHLHGVRSGNPGEYSTSLV